MKAKLMRVLVRITLFNLTLFLGLSLTIVSQDTTSLASTDLREAKLNAMAADAGHSRMYASATEGAQPTGFYVSTDNGRSWSNQGSGPPVGINAMVVSPLDPQVIYAGTNGGPQETAVALWHSFDGGQTWSSHGLNLPAGPDGQIPNVTALLVDRGNPDVLFIGTEGQGIFRLDSSAGLSRVGSGDQAFLNVRQLRMDSTGDLYVLAAEGLFRISGENWTALATPDAPVSMAVAEGNPNVIYLGGASLGLFKSTDRGATWTATNQAFDLTPGMALRVTAINIDRTNTARVHVATAIGLGRALSPGSIYQTVDGGRTWQALAPAEGLTTHLSSVDGRTLYAGSIIGLRTFAVEETGPGFTPGLQLVDQLPRLNLTQMLILTLTLLLGGLFLLGQPEWFSPGSRRASSISRI